MKRIEFYIDLPWGEDESMTRVANKLAAHINDHEFILEFLRHCQDMQITMSEHTKVENEPPEDV